MSWKRYFDNRILKRGYEYYKFGNILSLEYNDDNTVDAKVDGTRVYHVHIDLEDKLGMECTCPHYEEGNFCKHLAAVWYAVDNDEEAYDDEDDYYDEDDDYDDEDKHEVIKNYDLKGTCLQLDDINRMVDNCDVEVLKEFLKETLNSRSSILTQFISKTCSYMTYPLKVYEHEVISLMNSYRYIDYDNYEDFEKNVFDFIDTYIFKLVQDNRLDDAYHLTQLVIRKLNYIDIEEYELLESVLDTILHVWECILEKCNDMDLKRKMFVWFKNQLDISYLDLTSEIMYILSHYFNEEEFLEQTIELIKYKIQSLKYVDEYRRYELEKWLEYAFDLNINKEKYIKEYWHMPWIRQYVIKQSIDKKDYIKAISVLKESKKRDKDYSYRMTKEYSHQLLDIYQIIGDKEAYKEELWYMVYNYNDVSVETFESLKSLYLKEDWIIEREKIFKIAIREKRIENLYLKENMLEELFDYITSFHDINKIQSYEDYLKKDFSLELLDIYKKEVLRLVQVTGKRSYYQHIVYLLKRMLTYNEGKIIVKQLIDDWKIRYRNRPAMMQELDKIHF